MARVALHTQDPSCRLALVRAFESAPSTWDVFLWDGSASFDVRVTDVPTSSADVVFDECDPSATVREVGRLLSATSHRLTVVTGARRGTGVSTLALHLAAALSCTATTSLLDLDQHSSLRARLGLPDDARDWGRQDPASAGLPLSAGFRVFLAPSNDVGDAPSAIKAACIRSSHVVMDAPDGPWREQALSICTSAILVVPPSPQGIAHARLSLASHPGVRWLCVVVRLGAGGELTKRHVERALDHPIVAELPSSPYLRDREDEHRLLNERWSRYYRRTLRLAAILS